MPSLDAVGEVMGVTAKALLKWKGADTDGALEKKPEGYDIEAIRELRKRFLASSQKTRLIASIVSGFRYAYDARKQSKRASANRIRRTYRKMQR